MPAKDLGTKHVCFKCGTKFYDLKKPAPLCPKCGTDQREARPPRSPPPAEKKRAPAKAPAEPQIEAVEDLEEESEEVLDEEEAPHEDDE